MNLIVSSDGWIRVGEQRYRCALGRSGIGEKLREGDGVTPLGRYPLREVFFRADRLEPFTCALPVQAIRPEDGWCDDPADPNYNRRVTLPFSASHEQLWREDGVYDLIIVVGFNDEPIRPGAGSAIFLHVARPQFEPTEGCVALQLPDLLAVTQHLDQRSELIVREA